MNVYLMTFKSYPPHKVIADNIVDAMIKYKDFCIKRKISNCEERLGNITSIKYLEEFDYIQ